MKVLFMGKAAFKSRCKAIESAIIGQELNIDQLNRRLEAAKKMKKLRCIKLTLRTTWRGRRRPLRLKKSCSTTSPGTGRTKLYQ